METTLRINLFPEIQKEDIQTKIFSNKSGEKLTLPEIIIQNKKITRVIISCLPEKREELAPGFLKKQLGIKREVSYKTRQKFNDDIQIEIIDEKTVVVGIPLTDDNMNIYTKITECKEKGIKKEFISDRKEHIRLKFYVSIDRLLEINWK